MNTIIIDEFHQYPLNDEKGFDKYDLFIKMFEKQKELNNLTYPAWKEKLTLVDWQSAVLVEAGELLESFGYKWWKKQEKDLENVKVELIDILHFLLSDLHYYSKSVRMDAFERFMEAFEIDELDPYDDYLFKDTLLTLVSLCKKDITMQFFFLAKLFKYVGMDFDKVYRAYFVKNVLNEFRQKNGYKNGNYVKLWKIDLGDGIKEYEDNEVAYLIAKNLKLENIDTFLMKELNKIYQKIKEK